ncbi:MAG: hypothetical protein IJ325_07885 [Clostridia bacterium]|nr:hypothetical protein [Clostridia bacterium]
MRGFIREKIDSITQIESKQITRDNLRLHYGTGQEIVTKNSQGNKTSQYRSGVQTNLGDIEQSVWMALVQKLIEQEHDQEIFEQLLEWEKDNNHIGARTKHDILREAMQSYTYRIYDNKAWWDYVRFNMKYRPEILENDAELILVHLTCCGRECRIPQEQVHHNHEAPDTVPCPYCNKGTVFSTMQRTGVNT